MKSLQVYGGICELSNEIQQIINICLIWNKKKIVNDFVIKMRMIVIENVHGIS